MPQKRSKSRLVQTISNTLLIFLLTLGGLISIPLSEALATCEVRLAWDGSSGASGYRLYMRAEGESYSYAIPAWEGGGVQCTLATLNENTAYYFVVRAFDATGRESSDSNEVRFYLDTNPPGLPELINPANGAQNVSLTPDLTTGTFYDADRSEQHAATQWQVFRSADDLAVFDLSSDFFLTRLVLPPLILDESTSYSWQVRHRNQNGGTSEPAIGTFETGLWAADGDADGIPDAQEIAEPLDLDGNGQDDLSQAKMKCLRSVRGDVRVAVDAARSGSVVSLNAVQAVDNGTLETPYADHPELPAGLIAFKIITANAGDTAEVALYLSSAIAPNDQWVAFSMSAGYEDFGHASSISSDRRSIVVQVTDGGSGDLDGVANGSIVAMGGFGSLPSSSNLGDGSGGGGGGGGGGGCFINSLTLF